MARFLVTYHAAGMPQDPESVAAARKAFVEWAVKAGPALADPGAPVRSALVISSNGHHERRTAPQFLGWSVIEARDWNEAARVVADHPFIRMGCVLQISEPISGDLNGARTAAR